MSSTPPDIIRIYGSRSNVGKTTLIERLVPALTDRGQRVATIKHAHHGFELDRDGSDSSRHIHAGAAATMLLGPESSALLLQPAAPLSLDDARTRLATDADIILAEGFRAAIGPAIVLDPDAADHIAIHGDQCVIGIFPTDLNEAEMALLINFCLHSTSGLST